MLEEQKRIGKVKAVHSSLISNSRIGLGLEKLDRDHYDPNPLYDPMGELGVKWVRIQSGWLRTEKERGVYSFEWLDDIVDNLIERGMHPWMCLCYGHGMYTPAAAEYIGAVGFPPLEPDALEAWCKYVKATVEHYRGRVHEYEIWNEPDGTCWRHGANPSEYAMLGVATAKAIREVDPDARIFVGAIYERDLQFMDVMLGEGLAEYADALTFHDYTYDERYIIQRIRSMRALCDSHKPGIKIIMGESGSQSRTGGHGALNWIACNERMQAKQLARRAVADLIGDVEFTSYFSCVDMIECITGGKIGDDDNADMGYFGVIRNDPHATDAASRHSLKPSYFALQAISAIFHDVAPCEIPFMLTPKASPTIDGRDCTDASLIFGGFKKTNGSTALAFWNSTDMLTIKEYESTLSFQIASKEENPVLVDLLDGSVMAFTPAQYRKQGNIHYFSNIPVSDHPLLIAFPGFVDWAN